jgi:NTE family protein
MKGCSEGLDIDKAKNASILYLASMSRRADIAGALMELSQRNGGEYREDGETEIYSIPLEEGHHLEICLTSNIDELLWRAAAVPVDSILLDNREDDVPSSGFSSSMAGRVLPELLARLGEGRRLKKSAILVVLSESTSTAHHAFAAGALQLGGVIVAPPSMESLLISVCRTIKHPETGSLALCLAGGGIEGLFYELGVLRALDDCLDRSVTDFDIFSGISAGAVISACLANGVSPKALADALKGRPGQIDPITRGMLFDPNIGEIVGRVTDSLKDLARGHWLRAPLDAALKVTPNALFSGDRLRWYLEKQFSKPGMTNDFYQLNKKLFIGATDQDTATHVTFGEGQLKNIPISHAVRASTAMTPYYPPEKILGRFYIDGIFTRTVNLDIAVAHGAKLIVCIDPLSPVNVDQPGYVSGRGGFFNTVQSIKSMIRTRFSEVIGRAEEAYPNVRVVVFSPSPRDLEKMSGTLMRFFYRTETEDMAYASASEIIKEDYPWLAADFSRHGFSLIRPS